jgi:oxygen-dependent protoporphyrinogen oxidase
LSRAGGAWEVVTTRGRRLVADAVIVAVPAPAAGQLLANASPTAAAELRRIEYASVALVTLAYPRSSLGCALDGSGFLVPRVEGRLLTACSWVNSKWPHLDPKGAVVLRASAGRHRDRRALDLDDATLVDRLHAELTQAMGLSVRPTDARVHRWEGAFPQFAVGHLDRVARIEAALAVDAPGVTVAGAALRGVGLPTCIAGAQAAARRATQHLAGLAA